MAAAITVESLDSGKTLVDEKDALVTCKRSADKASCDERIATFLVSTLRCRMVAILMITLVVMITREDLENVSEVQVDEEGHYTCHRGAGCAIGHG